MSVNARVDHDGVEHVRMRVTATIMTTDGRTVHLNAHGELGVSPALVNYGD